jgi:ABC-type glycerol-3-phosphate transport system permease component
LTDWPAIMAGTILVSIPTLIIFIVFQRFFVQGIASTGGKE